MCDGGGYDGGGYSDPDYYDLEFREQNPDIYGNDEYMQGYYGYGRYSKQQRPTRKRRSRAQKEADRQFHEEYLKWKRKHPERIAALKENSVFNSGTGSGKTSVWPNIIAALILYPIVIFLIINACSN